MSNSKRGLFWFRNDLRLEDNPALNALCNACDEVIFVYVFDPELLHPTPFSDSRLGSPRWQFIKESLLDLEKQLADLSQQLIIKAGNPHRLLSQIISKNGISHMGVTPLSGFYEKKLIEMLQRDFETELTFHQNESFTLFDYKELPFKINAMPDSFTPFRKLIEKAIKPYEVTDKVVSKPTFFPKQIKGLTSDQLPDIQEFISPIENMIHQGGEKAARNQIDFYCHHSKLLSQYKQTRNGLDGWNFSSKLSAYLAQGCISPRQVMQTVIDYEKQFGANQSTYWLYFELLWREFYQWHQEKYGVYLYLERGIQNIHPELGFNQTNFTRWKEGNSESEFVNAFMRQLAITGWMSNRGRQIVASYFVNQFQLDWRYGAAWFEQQLIDYDPANNWGNWQYLAGVGVDPRGRRAFNIEKQQKTYDPQGKFILNQLNRHD